MSLYYILFYHKHVHDSINLQERYFHSLKFHLNSFIQNMIESMAGIYDCLTYFGHSGPAYIKPIAICSFTIVLCPAGLLAGDPVLPGRVWGLRSLNAALP
jgi:hypothetical protein